MTDPSALKLSALDLGWPGDLNALIPHLDQLGYHRYWATEHHTPRQSASPTLVAARGAALSQNLRVGAAGVLLKFYSPLKVAEDFRPLELFYPGRIDLGVSSTLLGGPLGDALLDGRPAPDFDHYVGKLEALTRLARDPCLCDEDGEKIEFGPTVSTLPEIWVCGMTAEIAQVAGRLGVGLAIRDHPQRADGVGVIEAYRSAYRPAKGMTEPAIAISCHGICAATESQAARLWDAACAELPIDDLQAKPQPCFLGSAEQCCEQLLRTAERYGSDEIVAQCISHDVAARLESFRLLAQGLTVQQRTHC